MCWRKELQIPTLKYKDPPYTRIIVKFLFWYVIKTGSSLTVPLKIYPLSQPSALNPVIVSYTQKTQTNHCSLNTNNAFLCQMLYQHLYTDYLINAS